MQISMMLSYAEGFRESARPGCRAGEVGLDLVWVAEAYGFDGPSFMGYLAAKTEHVQIGAGILPIYTRTPTLIAMTAAGLDALSGGRFQLGLGASGPQVIEGWHGVPYSAPIARTRDVIEICRKVSGAARGLSSTKVVTSRCRCRPGREPVWAGPSRSSPGRSAPASRSGSPRSARRTWR